jgi:hypothetical protein
MSVSPPIELLLARRELELERRRVELLRENQITFYSPHEKQVLFHTNASARYRYARTGNRFGKSEMGAAEDVAFALGYRPWLPEGDPLRTLGIPPHPTKGLIVTTDWDKSKEVFTEQEGTNVGKLIKYIPRASLGQPTRNHSGAIDRIPVKHITGGWSIIHLDTVKSYKQNPLGQESSVWDWAHIDEPCPEGMWKAIARGLVDRGGRGWFTCTPLTEPWIDDAFVPDLGSDRGLDATTFESGDRWMMTGSMSDNPHNSPEDIASFMAWLTDDEKDARLNGLPTSFAGLVFKEFRWNDHVITEETLQKVHGWKNASTPPKNWCVRYAIDYHFRKNDAVLFVATSPQDVSIVYAELWQQMLIDEEVEQIRRTLGSHIPLPGIVDPLASTPNKMTETTAMDEYRRLGLAVIPATKDPVNGIRAVKSTLKARDKHGRPVLYIASHLRRTLFEISRGFVWDGDENKPVKKNDDMMENLHRMCLQGLVYVEPTGENDYSPVVLPDFEDETLDFQDGPSLDEIRDKSRRARLASRYPANPSSSPHSFLANRYRN